jgi:hypothetical protein
MSFGDDTLDPRLDVQELLERSLFDGKKIENVLVSRKQEDHKDGVITIILEDGTRYHYGYVVPNS